MKIGIQTWGSEGDIRPFLALAAGLTRAGHQVTVVATDTEARSYHDLAIRHGFRLRMVATPVLKNPEQVDAIVETCVRAGNPAKQSRIIVDHLFAPALEEMASAGQDLAAESDLLIRHFFLYPLGIIAEQVKVPEVSVMLAHNCLPSREIYPPGFPYLGRWFNPLAWRICQAVVNRMFLGTVNRRRQEAGLLAQSDMMTEAWAAARLNLVAVSPAVCQAPSDWHERHQVCGFFNLPEKKDILIPSELESFLNAGPPPVYFTFGSLLPGTPGAVREIMAVWQQAARIVKCRAIIQGPVAAWTSPNNDSDIFYLTRGEHGLLFPRCQAVVHHGGAGTTQATLLAGVPSVVVAHVADQFFWGDELARLGVAGKPLGRRSLSATMLAKALQNVLNRQDFRINAKNLAVKIAAEDGVRVAVQTIESLFQ